MPSYSLSKHTCRILGFFLNFRYGIWARVNTCATSYGWWGRMNFEAILFLQVWITALSQAHKRGGWPAHRSQKSREPITRADRRTARKVRCGVEETLWRSQSDTRRCERQIGYLIWRLKASSCIIKWAKMQPYRKTWKEWNDMLNFSIYNYIFCEKQ